MLVWLLELFGLAMRIAIEAFIFAIAGGAVSALKTDKTTARKFKKFANG